MRQRVQVKCVQQRNIMIYRYEKNPKTGQFQKTDDVLEVKQVQRERVLFAGSEEAFKTWREAGNHIPEDAKIRRWAKKNDL